MPIADEDREGGHRSRRGIGAQGEHERQRERRQPEDEPDQAEVGGCLDVRVLDAPLVLAGRKGQRRDVGELLPRGRELRVDHLRIGGRLPTRADDGMVAPDAVADVGEQRVVRIRLDVGGLRLASFQMHEPQEVLEVAGT